MNSKQWFVLSFAFIIVGGFFAYTDSILECNGMGDLSAYDIWCILNDEIYDPFIWILLIFGGFVFPIMGWLEPEKK